MTGRVYNAQELFGQNTDNIGDLQQKIISEKNKIYNQTVTINIKTPQYRSEKMKVNAFLKSLKQDANYTKDNGKLLDYIEENKPTSNGFRKEITIKMSYQQAQHIQRDFFNAGVEHVFVAARDAEWFHVSSNTNLDKIIEQLPDYCSRLSITVKRGN